MSRIDRLKEYARPNRRANWNGAASDQKNIDRWSDRAADNSKIAPRASDGEMKLPATGKQVELRDTSSAPRYSRNADARMVAKDDVNHVGSSYMRGIRRDA
jgi:hypothetical protein